MKEKCGDLFKSDANVKVIPIHKSLDDANHLVMSRGVMYQAVKIYPELPKLLGAAIHNSDKSSVIIQTFDGQIIVGFTTKECWCDPDPSSITTLVDSAESLLEIINTKFKEPELIKVALPRLGCGGGKLPWEFVKPWLEDVLDDRFTVYYRELEVPEC